MGRDNSNIHDGNAKQTRVYKGDGVKILHVYGKRSMRSLQLQNLGMSVASRYQLPVTRTHGCILEQGDCWVIAPFIHTFTCYSLEEHTTASQSAKTNYFVIIDTSKFKDCMYAHRHTLQQSKQDFQPWS